jgi:uncharacterized membrane protein YfcA
MSAATTLGMLALASFLAAAVNAMAGGGTFITFPALTGLAKLTEIVANVTSTVGLWPGYAASVVSAREALRRLDRSTVVTYAGVGLAGGAAGAILLLATSITGFAKAVPWLLAVSTAMLAAGPKIRDWAGRSKGAASQRPTSPGVLAIVTLIAIYNGYFGAGGGVLLLAGMAVVMPGDVRRLNLLKVVIQVTANASAIAVFVSAGIDWKLATAMACGSVVGGFVGMRLAIRMPERALRGAMIAVGTALTAVYFVKVYS